MLFKKLLRTMGKYKAQFISMIIMITLGVGVFLGFNMEWYSIKKNTDYIFEKSGFADFRLISEEGFKEADLEKVKQIDGVEDATRYISINTSVKDSDDIIALAVSENINVSGFMLIGEGNIEYSSTSKDGIWLSDQYASKNNVKLNDTLTLNYKNYEISGKVVGLIKASEYLVCVPDETQIMPDFNTYGFAYISPLMFKNVLGFNFYTQINVKAPALSKKGFSSKVDSALAKTTLVLSKDETVSYSSAKSEEEEGKTTGSILPVLFLAIAILTMISTMHRLVTAEKTQIGILKALGFKDRKIILHYTTFAIFISVVGSVLGVALGYAVARLIMNPSSAMGTYLDVPNWNLYMPWFGIVVLIAMNLVIIGIGYLSIKNVLKGPASEALRPYTPKKMKVTKIEKTKLWNKFSFGTKWNMRDISRHKARSAMTTIGVLGCAVLVIAALGMQDTMNKFVDVFYNQAINYETRLNISENTSNEKAIEIANEYNGDYSSQSSVKIGEKAVSLEIYNISNDKVRFVNEDMKFVTLANDGAYICERIAKEFSLKPGDAFICSPYGQDESYNLVVKDILKSMSEAIIMNEDYAKSKNINYHINLVYTSESNINTNENIINTQSKSIIIKSFDSFMELMNISVTLLIIAAVVLGVVVLYNLGVMSFMERYREMSTLKVLGFKDKKIGNLLITQNMWISILGTIIGIPLGVWTLDYLIKALASEYEMSLSISWLSFVISILITLGVSWFVSIVIANKNKKIDMVESLKCSE